MIDEKRVVQIAKEKAAEYFGGPSSLEEIERDLYRNRDGWSVTLALPREMAGRRQYKRFFIDAETGEFTAVKIREVAAQ